MSGFVRGLSGFSAQYSRGSRATRSAKRQKKSASGSAFDKFTVLDDDDSMGGSLLADDGLLARENLLSGDTLTDEDDAVANFGLHDRDSTIERASSMYECTETKSTPKKASIEDIRKTLDALDRRLRVIACQPHADAGMAYPLLFRSGFPRHLGRRGITRHLLLLRP